MATYRVIFRPELQMADRVIEGVSMVQWASDDWEMDYFWADRDNLLAAIRNDLISQVMVTE